ECDEVFWYLGDRNVQDFQVLPHAVAAAFAGLLSPGVVNEDAAHSLSRRCKEMTPAVPILRFIGIHQAQVSLVNQGRRFQRLPRLFLSQFLGRQFAQLIINQRQELCGSLWFTLFDGAENARDLTHGGRRYPPETLLASRLQSNFIRMWSAAAFVTSTKRAHGVMLAQTVITESILSPARPTKYWGKRQSRRAVARMVDNCHNLHPLSAANKRAFRTRKLAGRKGICIECHRN